MNTPQTPCSLKLSDTVNNEQGYITLVTVLGVLLLLTVISASMIDTSINDQQIVRNDKLNKRNFYLAESGAYEAAQGIENANTTETDPTASLAWVQNTLQIYFENRDFWRDPNNNYAWYTVNNLTLPNVTIASIPSANFYAIAGTPVPADGNQDQPDSNLEIFDNSATHRDDVHLAANFGGVAGGSSLKVTTTTGRLYAYYVFGMYSSQLNGLGEALIEVGYRKRF